jgi:VanZ family protein
LTRHLPWVIWLLVLSILSLTPGNKLPEIKFDLFELDKLIHFTFYFILVILMNIGFRLSKNEPFYKSIVLIIVIGILIGWSIEFVQGEFITNRQFDYLDIFANSLGTVVGMLIYVKYLITNYKLW